MAKGMKLILAFLVTVQLAHCCQEGALSAAKFNCGEYNECIDGVLVRKRCPGGTHFNGITCDLKRRVNCKPASCPGGSTAERGHCLSDYDVCFLGSVFTQQCPDEQRFDGAKCVPSDKCNTIREIQSRKKNSPLLILEDQCKDGSKTYHPTDCTMYRQCISGQWTDKTCPWLSHFDTVKNDCSYWEYTCGYGEDCKENEVRSVYGRCSEYQKCEKTRWTTQVCDAGTYFQYGSCQNKPCPLKPVLNNCTYFKEPEDEHLYPCPAQQQFDKIERQCVPKQDARCLEGECEDGDTTYNADDCTKYKLCQDLKWTDQQCGWMRHYDVVSKSCAFYSYTCGNDKSKTFIDGTTIAPGECVDGTKQGDNENCRKYKQCDGGKWVDHECFSWGKFDAVTKECYYFQLWKVNCSKN